MSVYSLSIPSWPLSKSAQERNELLRKMALKRRFCLQMCAESWQKLKPFARVRLIVNVFSKHKGKYGDILNMKHVVWMGDRADFESLPEGIQSLLLDAYSPRISGFPEKLVSPPKAYPLYRISARKLPPRPL